MTKLTLNPAPTFTAGVEIPLPSGELAKPVFTFKHRTRESLNELLANKEISTADLVEAICSGWDLEEPFNRENVEKLCSNFIMAPRLLMNAYTAALVEGRRGN